MIQVMMDKIWYWIVLMVESFNTYWGLGYVYLGLYVACMVWLFVTRKKHENGYMILFVYGVILLITVLVNPVSMKIAEKTFLKGVGERVRLWYLLPVWFTICYAVAEVLGSAKKKAVTFIGLIAVTAVLIISGALFDNGNHLIKRTNVYAMNQDALDAAEIMMSVIDDPNDMEILEYSIGVEGDHNYLDEGGSISDELQCYYSKFKAYNGFPTYNYYEKDLTEKEMVETLSGYVEMPKIYFVVIHPDERMDSVLEVFNFKKLGTTGSGNYDVYQKMQEE